MKPGDEMVVTYVPGTGTSMAINGQNKVTIADPVWSGAVFGVAWAQATECGPEEGMLGQ